MIVRAIISDAKLLSEIAMKSKAFWKYTKKQLESWQDDLTVSKKMIQRNIVFNYLLDDKIVGFYILNCANNKKAELEFLFVLPNFIGKSIGKKLLHHAIKKSEEQNCRSITVLSDPNAVPFYSSQGFYQIDQKESAIPNRFLPILERKL